MMWTSTHSKEETIADLREPTADDELEGVFDDGLEESGTELMGVSDTSSPSKEEMKAANEFRLCAMPPCCTRAYCHSFAVR